jgi:RND family efflux transporter MFP subunit
MTDMRAIAVVLIQALALAACGGKDKPAAAAAPAAKQDHPVKESELNSITLAPETETRLGIKVEPMAQRAVPRTRLLAGEVVVPPGMMLDVFAPIAGTLAAAGGGAPQPGRSVRRGEPLLRIIPLSAADRDIRINAERDLSAARATVDAARQRVARAERLVQDGSVSRRSLEEARADLASAEANLVAGQERLAVVNRSHINQANELVVPAPIDGMVNTIHAAIGQTVGSGANLLQISRLDRVWVRVPVYAGDARDLNLDEGAAVVRLGDAADAPGVMARRVAAPPTATPAASAIDVTFEPPPGSGLQPGERVRVRVAARATRTGNVISTGALLHDIHGGVWVYERTAPRTYARRRVEVEDTIGGLALLARGPALGKPIVTQGAAELYGVEFGVGK